MDGLPDLVVGENRTANSNAWVLYNAGTTPAFDATPGQGLNQTRVGSATSMGLSVAAGDFNHDGRPDFAAADPFEGTGRVSIWY
jgi:hypothetical protein